MKTTKIFMMAALALTFAACSNDDNELTPLQPQKAEGIPFSATITVDNGTTTRALNESSGTIVATWADGEEVALIYNAGGTPTKTEAVVTKQPDGSATISATLAAGATDGSNVTIIYPASAADGTTGNVKSDLLFAQDGTLTGTGGTSIAEKYDVRKGTGKLSISGGKATVNNGTAGTPVTLSNQLAIFKFTVKNADGSATINVKPLTITIGAQDYVITPASATSELFVALPAVSSQTVSFTATASDSKTYSYSKDGVTFAAGKYYQSTLKMKRPLTAITLNKTTTLLGVGNTETLSVSTVTPDDATDQTVTWSSDNEEVATVNATTGEVTAVAVGTANITATANDGSGVTATCAVKVTTLAGALVNNAVIQVNFKWRSTDSGDYVQGIYNAASGTFTASKGGEYWSSEDDRAVYKVEKNGDNIIIGAAWTNYDQEGIVWTFNTTNDTYTTKYGWYSDSNRFGPISVSLNGTDITSQLTAQ